MQHKPESFHGSQAQSHFSPLNKNTWAQSHYCPYPKISTLPLPLPLNPTSTPSPQPYPSNLPLNPTPTKWDDNPSRPLRHQQSLMGLWSLFHFLFGSFDTISVSGIVLYSLKVLGMQPYPHGKTRYDQIRMLFMLTICQKLQYCTLFWIKHNTRST